MSGAWLPQSSSMPPAFGALYGDRTIAGTAALQSAAALSNPQPPFLRLQVRDLDEATAAARWRQGLRQALVRLK